MGFLLFFEHKLKISLFFFSNWSSFERSLCYNISFINTISALMISCWRKATAFVVSSWLCCLSAQSYISISRKHMEENSTIKMVYTQQLQQKFPSSLMSNNFSIHLQCYIRLSSNSMFNAIRWVCYSVRWG
jgi:hypothetical protein